MNIKPLGDRVVIKPVVREEKTKGGLYIPDTAVKEKPMEGEIHAVGDGRILDDGSKLPLSVQTGQRVIFAKYAGTEVKFNDEEYLIISEKDILAIVE